MEVKARWMVKVLAVLITYHLSLITSFAQTVTGTVTEMLGGAKEPIIGANVTFQNSQNRIVSGTVTDFNGNYTLKVPEEKNLTIDFA